MQIQKKIPETIADLSINWTFNQNKYHDFLSFRLDFQNSNPNLPNYSIISGDYIFEFCDNTIFKNNSFIIHSIYPDKVSTLLYFIHHNIRTLLIRENVKGFELGRFMNIDKNKFRIEEDLPF